MNETATISYQILPLVIIQNNHAIYNSW